MPAGVLVVDRFRIVVAVAVVGIVDVGLSFVRCSCDCCCLLLLALLRFWRALDAFWDRSIRYCRYSCWVISCCWTVVCDI